jgi:hypothetical protein
MDWLSLIARAARINYATDCERRAARPTRRGRGEWHARRPFDHPAQ